MVNRSRYEWDEGNYEGEDKEMGALCFTQRVRRMQVSKGFKLPQDQQSMTDHRNPNYGYRTIFKPSKYSGAQGR
jgi:hypothetical protein